MFKKTVHVIVPTYNSSKNIRKCLDSILQNNYPFLDIVCIDDGSEDNTCEIISIYVTLHSNIRLIKKKNGGPSSARNVGLNAVNDKDGYISFVDSDDFVDMDYFSSLVLLLECNDADVVCAMYYFSSGNNETKAKTIKERVKVLSSYESLLEIFKDNYIDSMSHHKLFRTCIWEGVRYPEDLFFLEDTATIFRTFIRSNKILLSDYCGYHYFQDNTNSIMKSPLTNDRILSAWHSFIYLFEYDFSSFSSGEKYAIKQCINNLFADNFLELYPRFAKNNNKNEERFITSYIRYNKIVRNFQPKILKQKIKKIVYILFPRLYRPIFNIYISVYKK